MKLGTKLLDLKIYYNTYSVTRYFLRGTASKESEKNISYKHLGWYVHQMKVLMMINEGERTTEPDMAAIQRLLEFAVLLGESNQVHSIVRLIY